MKKEIITFGKWYENHSEFHGIFDDVPLVILQSLYPDACVTWLSNCNPPITLSSAVFEEASHKFYERYVYVPHLVGEDNFGQIERIKKDIMFQALSEWNHWIAIKELLNSQMNEEQLFKLLGNYSLTKEGGWTDWFYSQAFTDTTTYPHETGSSLSIQNFEGNTINPLTSQTITTAPPAGQNLTHTHTPNTSPGRTERAFDGSTTPFSNYHEYGQRMGHLWEYYKDLIHHFPNVVDMFLTTTASAYLTDVYDTNMWCHILSDDDY